MIGTGRPEEEEAVTEDCQKKGFVPSVPTAWAATATRPGAADLRRRLGPLHPPKADIRATQAKTGSGPLIRSPQRSGRITLEAPGARPRRLTGRHSGAFNPSVSMQVSKREDQRQTGHGTRRRPRWWTSRARPR